MRDFSRSSADLFCHDFVDAGGAMQRKDALYTL